MKSAAMMTLRRECDSIKAESRHIHYNGIGVVGSRYGDAVIMAFP